MKKAHTILFAALIAAALCVPASARDRSGNRPPGVSRETQAKKPVRKGKKKAQVKKKGKTAAKAKKSAPITPAGGAKESTPPAAPSTPFSTPPPGTGYGNIDPEPPAYPPPARR